LMQNRKITINNALDIILQIALALNYAHKDFNIVHRDIKPENILYKEEVFKLSDWGLAGIQILLSHTSGYKGTLAYSAPEQLDATKGRIGPWTDVWQLGVVLYELITGELPFGDNIGEIVNNILHEPPKKIENIDERIWQLIEKMLQKNPEDRPTIIDIIKTIRKIKENQ
ncbi:MAG: serine/threonine-protein kinase, partial [Candidatus Asgardarchaeia archaeon]